MIDHPIPPALSAARSRAGQKGGLTAGLVKARGDAEYYKVLAAKAVAKRRAKKGGAK